MLSHSGRGRRLQTLIALATTDPKLARACGTLSLPRVVERCHSPISAAHFRHHIVARLLHLLTIGWRRRNCCPGCPGTPWNAVSISTVAQVTVEPIFPGAQHLCRCRRTLYRCRARLHRCHASTRWYESTRLTRRTTFPCVHRSQHRQRRFQLGQYAAYQSFESGKRLLVAWVPVLAGSNTPAAPISACGSTCRSSDQPTTHQELMPGEHLRSARVSEV